MPVEETREEAQQRRAKQAEKRRLAALKAAEAERVRNPSRKRKSLASNYSQDKAAAVKRASIQPEPSVETASTRTRSSRSSLDQLQEQNKHEDPHISHRRKQQDDDMQDDDDDDEQGNNESPENLSAGFGKTPVAAAADTGIELDQKSSAQEDFAAADFCPSKRSIARKKQTTKHSIRSKKQITAGNALTPTRSSAIKSGMNKPIFGSPLPERRSRKDPPASAASNGSVVAEPSMSAAEALGPSVIISAGTVPQPEFVPSLSSAPPVPSPQSSFAAGAAETFASHVRHESNLSEASFQPLQQPSYLGEAGKNSSSHASGKSYPTIAMPSKHVGGELDAQREPEEVKDSLDDDLRVGTNTAVHERDYALHDEQILSNQVAQEEIDQSASVKRKWAKSLLFYTVFALFASSLLWLVPIRATLFGALPLKNVRKCFLDSVGGGETMEPLCSNTHRAEGLGKKAPLAIEWVPCPAGAYCKGGRLLRCPLWHSLVQDDEETSHCFLSADANETIARIQNLLHDWTIESICSVDENEGQAAFISEWANRPYFKLEHAEKELDLDEDEIKDLLYLGNVTPGNDVATYRFLLEKQQNGEGPWAALHPHEPLKIPFPCQAWLFVFGVLVLVSLIFQTIMKEIVWSYYRAFLASPLYVGLASLLVTGVSYSLYRRNVNRAALRGRNLAIVQARQAVIERLQQEYQEGEISSEWLCQDLAWTLYPASRKDRKQFAQQTWPCVVRDISEDVRVTKSMRIEQGKNVEYWQWKPPPRVNVCADEQNYHREVQYRQ